MKVLLIDNELYTRRVLSKHLKKEGFYVQEDSNGTSTLDRILQKHFDLVVLEIDLPRANGLELCEKIRNESHTPVLILTRKHSQTDLFSGFEAGADDFVFKPFSPREVVHRISSIIRRTSDKVFPMSSRSIIFSKLCLIPNGRTVTVDGVEIDLTIKEYELLYYLINHAGQALSRENLLADVWHYVQQRSGRTIDTHIKRLRDKMNAASPGSGELIQTIRGVGYSMNNWQKSSC